MKKYFVWMFAAVMSLNLASAFANDAADEEDVDLQVEEEQVVAIAEDNADCE